MRQAGRRCAKAGEEARLLCATKTERCHSPCMSRKFVCNTAHFPAPTSETQKWCSYARLFGCGPCRSTRNDRGYRQNASDRLGSLSFAPASSTASVVVMTALKTARVTRSDAVSTSAILVKEGTSSAIDDATALQKPLINDALRLSRPLNRSIVRRYSGSVISAEVPRQKKSDGIRAMFARCHLLPPSSCRT
jgi:hypothetical protein